MEFVWSFLFAAWHLTGLVLRKRVVAAQVCNPPDVFWPLAIAMRLLGRKWIFDHHDLCPELYDCKPGPTNKLVWRTLVAFERLSIRCASAVTTTNESYRTIAIERDGCPPEKITVVRNGPAGTEIAAAPSTPGEGARQQIVYLGVINPQDRVDIAVAAAERLAELRGRDDWELVVAGDGECLPDLRRMVAERGLQDVVRFTGWLEAAEVDAVLAAASIAIQPDPPTDMAHLSTMAKTIEYLARGLPVVAVDLVETRRSAEDAAVYVPTGTPDEFAKAIDGLLGDGSARARMRVVALERFRTVLAWEHQAAAYVATWQSLVPTGPEAGRLRTYRASGTAPGPAGSTWIDSGVRRSWLARWHPYPLAARVSSTGARGRPRRCHLGRWHSVLRLFGRTYGGRRWHNVHICA